MPGREGKFSVFKLDHNLTIDLRFHTHYESNDLTASATITTIYLVLRAVSADLQTSR